MSKFVDEDGFGLVLDEVGTPGTKAIIVTKRESLEEQVQRHEHNQRVYGKFDIILDHFSCRLLTPHAPCDML